MASLVGHGQFKEYSCEVTIEGLKTIDEIIDGLSMPQILRENLIPVKGSNVIETSDLIGNNDVIHLYMMLHGG